MSDDNDSGGGTTTTISKSEPPAWVQGRSVELMDRGAALSQTPYTPYSGQRMADVDPATYSGLNMMQNRAMQGSPLSGAADTNLMQTLGGQYMSPDSNPYLRGMVGQAMGDVSSRVNSQFSGANYGSTAHQETLARSLGDMANQMYGQNYANERTNQMRAAGMAPQMAADDFRDSQAMIQAGDARRMLQQEPLNLAYQNWVEAQQDPYKKLDTLAATISTAGGGYANTASSAPNPYKTSNVSNIIGGGLLGLGAYNSGLFG